MHRTRRTTTFVLLTICGLATTGCDSEEQGSGRIKGPATVLRGASSYTPYDAFSMLWAREAKDRSMVWVSSGSDAGRLLVSRAEPERRPDWAFCSQGVVAGLAAKGEQVVIIGTTYVSDDVVLPVFRTPRKPLEGARSLFIARSSIELAFDRLLEREGVSRESIRMPTVETVGFTTIQSLLAKPVEAPDALDFAVLVDPFVTNLIGEQPQRYEIGEGGLYELHYSIVARKEDLERRRGDFVELLRQFKQVDSQLAEIDGEAEFRSRVWGRKKDGQPEYFPEMRTYNRRPARLELRATALRGRLREELEYLTSKYPQQLEMPEDVDALVDASLLEEVAPGRVIR